MVEWRKRQRERAAQLIADGATQREVSEALDLHTNTVWSWTHEPAFAAMVDAAQQARLDALTLRGIAVRTDQLAAIQRDWDRLESILVERSADPALAGTPGGKSGYILRKCRTVATNDKTAPVKEVFDQVFDHTLLLGRVKLLEYAARVAGWAQQTAPTLDDLREETRRAAQRAGLSPEDTERAIESAERMLREPQF